MLKFRRTSGTRTENIVVNGDNTSSHSNQDVSNNNNSTNNSNSRNNSNSSKVAENGSNSVKIDKNNLNNSSKNGIVKPSFSSVGKVHASENGITSGNGGSTAPSGGGGGAKFGYGGSQHQRSSSDLATSLKVIQGLTFICNNVD